MDDNELFRKEVLLPNKEKGFLYKSTHQEWRMVRIFLPFLGLLLIAILSSHYTKKESLEGRVVTEHLVKLYAPEDGLLRTRSQLLMPCEKGQQLFSIQTLHLASDTESYLEKNIQHLQEELEALRKRHELQKSRFSLDDARFKKQILECTAQLSVLTRLSQLETQSLELAKEQEQKMQQLYQANHQAKQAYTEAISQRLAQEKAVENLKLQVLSTESKQREFQTGLANLAHQRQQDEETYLAELHMKEREQNNYASSQGLCIFSPLKGYLSALQVSGLEQVHRGQFLASVSPIDAQYKVELYATSRSIGQLKVGQKVSIRYVPFPHQKFGSYRGTIESVSNLALKAQDDTLPQQYQLEPVYKVMVRLGNQSVTQGKQQYELKVGMLAQASVEIERRRLISWILLPIFSQFKGDS